MFSEVNEKRIRLEKSNVELQNALDEIQVLSGLLLICASCKNIHDDKGYWNQIEGYEITSNSLTIIQCGRDGPCRFPCYILYVLFD